MHVQLYQTPRSAGGLPVTRNMPYSQSSMPSLSQPRNMTGIYLGLEGNLKPPRPKTGVPPLARSRGASRMKTPTEEQRYKKVELLRIKEEKRGFSGNPVKRRQQLTSVHSNDGSGGQAMTSPQQAITYPSLASHEDIYQTRRWGPGKRIDPGNLDDLLRPNPRNYTTVSNSGVTRSEKLTGWLGGGSAGGAHAATDFYGDLKPAALASKEMGRVSSSDLAGLEECFRKVCKGNVDVLYSLLPGRKPHTPRRDSTGFTVRSYRNPNQAEILADFTRTTSTATDRASRPKTVPVRRPVVPQPYFFRHYSNHPGASVIAAQTRQLGHHSSVSGADDAELNNQPIEDYDDMET